MREEQGQQQNEKTGIFILTPDIEKGLHPHAAVRYRKWLIEVLQEIA